MATGGSGDSLSGVIASLLGQGFSALDAARLGTYLHGTAGDLAAKNVGSSGMTATDIVTYLPEAFRLYHHRLNH
jgi:NAD(P)H-hydrate epimerase